MRLADFISRLPRIRIRDEAELATFVTRVCAVCLVAAIGLGALIGGLAFGGWTSAIRAAPLAALLGLALAFPVSRAIARRSLDLHRARLVVEDFGRRDRLTGLLNRRALLQPERDGPVPESLVLAIVAIDHFERISQVHGREAADEVIQAVARILAEELEGMGRLGRLGGEEFGLMAFGLGLDQVAERLWRVRDAVATTPIMIGMSALEKDAARRARPLARKAEAPPLFVTISAGLAERQPQQTLSGLCGAADRAMKLAKAAGRNRVVLAPLFPGTAVDTEADEAKWRLDAEDEIRDEQRAAS